MDEPQRFRLNVYHDGAFLFVPLRYGGGESKHLVIPRIPLHELRSYIEAETGSPVRCLYYVLNPDDFASLMKLKTANDLHVFYDVAETYGTMNVYVDHLSIDLGHHINNVPSDRS